MAFAIGVFMLFDRGDPYLRLSLAWVLPATGLTALFFIFVAGAGIRAQRLPARTGAGSLVGRTALAVETDRTPAAAGCSWKGSTGTR